MTRTSKTSPTDGDQQPDLTRRTVLRWGGMTLLLSAIDPSLARAAGESSRLGELGRQLGPGYGRRRTNKTLIHIFLRGGVDGLNTVVPVESGEYALYQSYRPTLHVDRTDPEVGPLTPDFALHPLLKNGLHRLWLDGMLAVLPDVGYPSSSRSHFDSQSFIDKGVPFDNTTTDGWLNRYLQAAPPSSDPFRALALGKTTPEALLGPSPVVTLTDLNQLRVSDTDPVRNAKMLDGFDQAYAEPTRTDRYDAALRVSGSGLLRAIATLPVPLPAPTVQYPGGEFAYRLLQLSQILRTDLFAVEVAEIDLDGFDTHANQQLNTYSGRLPQLQQQVSDGIKALVDDLGPGRMANTLILTTTEFGRTARMNGTNGTDHGSAWASFAIGPGVNPGIHHGPGGWRGLDTLRENRDLIYTVDYRDVFSEVLARHLGVLTPDIFPGWSYTPVGFLA